MAVQTGWQWCSGCGTLVHDSREGACPQSTAHARVSAYQLTMGDDPAAGVPGFRWCGRCSQLFYGPLETSSKCPAGGVHTSAESGRYVVPPVTANRPEAGWFRCARCQSLFYGNRGVGGTCFDGAGHRAEDEPMFQPAAEKVKLGIERMPKLKR